MRLAHQPTGVLALTCLFALSSCGMPNAALPQESATTALNPDATLNALSGTRLSDATARSRVTAAGIPVVSSGNCSTRSVSTCTSLEQIYSGTIDGILTLKRASGCALNITGGTEVGHASGTYSHYNGYKLDTSLSTCINSYVTSNFTYIGLRGDGAPQYKSAAGNIYAKESSHWDILYY
ncbi:hypothetical protein ACFFLM_03710 [Deinococcus oregonensis]|uniref:Uncharacterized protein n=1 Tax=Deinococcus oregonensis TaxID=1805970 RepID=A0ABV6AUH5_9DEIO